MESSSSSPIVFDSPGFLRIYEDGTVERFMDSGTVPPSSLDDNFDEEKEGVASKDVLLDPQTGVFVRLYLPRLQATDEKGRVPVLLYFHGGGFCIESAASPLYHSYLNKVATEAKVICVSVEYRRAPEHRLPVAYDDCFVVLEWLDRQATALEGVPVDPWLASHADFSNVFLAGDSAGANIVHEVGVRPNGPRSPALSTLVYPRTLVFVAEKDLLRDRGILYYEDLKKAGKDVDLVTTEGENHCFHLLNPKSENAPSMMKRIADFMYSSSDH